MFPICALAPLIFLFVASCSVPDLDTLGRPCGSGAPCGAGARCDPTQKICVAAPTLVDGAVDCTAGQLRCDGRCVDPSTDNAHCGGCSKPCGASLDCQASVCVCKPGGRCAGCCHAGSCVPLAGQSTKQCGKGGATCSSCDDGLGCTVDSCGAGGCASTVTAGACRIQGKCHAAAAINAQNACQRCEPGVSPHTWTDIFGPGCVGTVAGSGQVGQANGQVAAASFGNPQGMAVDAAGAIYVADRDNNRVRKIAGGQVTTLAGSGGYGLVDGPAALAEFKQPSDVAVDATGKVYVADRHNNAIRVIHNGTVSTFVGGKSSGFKDGPLKEAQFRYPSGVALDSKGTLYVTDVVNRRVRMVSGGMVSTLAGDGSVGKKDGPALQATFNDLEGIALGLQEKAVYVVDTMNNNIRKIEAGVVTTVVGNGAKGYVDGPVATAGFDHIISIVVDKAGAFYVGEKDQLVIRKISGGMVSTVAGVGTSGYLDGEALKAAFTGVWSLAMDASGVIYVSDGLGHYIRKYQP